MTGSWWCDEEAAENGATVLDTELMREIAAYNEVDCNVSMELSSIC